jgi:hypothetical protein
MPRVVIRVDSDFDARSAAAAVRESEAFYEKRSATLALEAKFREASAKEAVGVGQGTPPPRGG